MQQSKGGLTGPPVLDTVYSSVLATNPCSGFVRICGEGEGAVLQSLHVPGTQIPGTSRYRYLYPKVASRHHVPPYNQNIIVRAPAYDTEVLPSWTAVPPLPPRLWRLTSSPITLRFAASGATAYPATPPSRQHLLRASDPLRFEFERQWR